MKLFILFLVIAFSSGAIAVQEKVTYGEQQEWIQNFLQKGSNPIKVPNATYDF